MPIGVPNAYDNPPSRRDERLTAPFNQSRNGLRSYIVDGFAQADGADLLMGDWKILYCADVPFGIVGLRLTGYFYNLLGNVNADEMTVPAT